MSLAMVSEVLNHSKNLKANKSPFIIFVQRTRINLTNSNGQFCFLIVIYDPYDSGVYMLENSDPIISTESERDNPIETIKVAFPFPSTLP